MMSLRSSRFGTITPSHRTTVVRDPDSAVNGNGYPYADLYCHGNRYANCHFHTDRNTHGDPYIHPVRPKLACILPCILQGERLHCC